MGIIHISWSKHGLHVYTSRTRQFYWLMLIYLQRFSSPSQWTERRRYSHHSSSVQQYFCVIFPYRRRPGWLLSTVAVPYTLASNVVVYIQQLSGRATLIEYMMVLSSVRFDNRLTAPVNLSLETRQNTVKMK